MQVNAPKALDMIEENDYCPVRRGLSLEGFVGHRAYDIRQPRGDLDGFVFLLGGSDGGSLFSPGAAVASV